MSYQERRSIVNLLSTIIITVFYTAYMVQRYPEVGEYSKEVFHYWGSFFLVLIPVSIVARILIYILFSIFEAVATAGGEPPITDERDKMIESKGQTNAGYVFIFGFITAMGSLVVDMPPSGMFVILLCSGVVSEIISEISQFYYYRRGF